MGLRARARVNDALACLFWPSALCWSSPSANHTSKFCGCSRAASLELRQGGAVLPELLQERRLREQRADGERVQRRRPARLREPGGDATVAGLGEGGVLGPLREVRRQPAQGEQHERGAGHRADAPARAQTAARGHACGPAPPRRAPRRPSTPRRTRSRPLRASSHGSGTPPRRRRLASRAAAGLRGALGAGRRRRLVDERAELSAGPATASASSTATPAPCRLRPLGGPRALLGRGLLPPGHVARPPGRPAQVGGPGRAVGRHRGDEHERERADRRHVPVPVPRHVHEEGDHARLQRHQQRVQRVVAPRERVAHHGRHEAARSPRRRARARPRRAR